MKNVFRTIVSILVFFLVVNINLYAAGSEKDTIVTLDSDVADFANPFAFKALVGDTVQFVSINGEFAILIRYADKFFLDVGHTIKIHLNDGDVSEMYFVKSELPIDTEIKYEVYCITQNRWADAPPRIIIVPHDEY